MTVENNLFKFIIASFLLFSAVNFSRFAFAQDGINNGQGFEEPGVGPIVERSETAGEAVAGNDRAMFNYWWMLPIILIPALMYIGYLAVPKDRHSRMDLSSGYAGAKGGRANRDRYGDTEGDLKN